MWILHSTKVLNFVRKLLSQLLTTLSQAQIFLRATSVKQSTWHDAQAHRITKWRILDYFVAPIRNVQHQILFRDSQVWESFSSLSLIS